jgi:crooked neck
METMLIKKRREYFEKELIKNKYNYDMWLDYIRMEEQQSVPDKDIIREVYERAIANQPLILEKMHWTRYIYIWLNYAVFEETKA